MTVDLACLVANAVWGALLVTLEILAKTRLAGPEWNMGNRDEEPKWPAWVHRTGRALSNHKENFPLFLTAVVVVHLVHANDRVSAAGAIGYCVARAAHALLYVGGVTRLRTIAYLAGIASVVVILSRLFV